MAENNPESGPFSNPNYVNEGPVRFLQGPLMRVNIGLSLGHDGKIRYVARGNEPNGNPFGIESEAQATPEEAMRAISDSLELQNELRDSARLNRLLEEIKADHMAGEIDYDIDSLIEMVKITNAFDIDTKRELYSKYESLKDMADYLGIHVLDLFKELAEDPDNLPESPED